MDADYQDFKHKELTESIIEIFYRVYNELVMVFLKRFVRRQPILKLGFY